jgi:hypothetical protein
LKKKNRTPSCKPLPISELKQIIKKQNDCNL